MSADGSDVPGEQTRPTCTFQHVVFGGNQRGDFLAENPVSPRIVVIGKEVIDPGDTVPEHGQIIDPVFRTWRHSARS